MTSLRYINISLQTYKSESYHSIILLERRCDSTWQLKTPNQARIRIKTDVKLVLSLNATISFKLSNVHLIGIFTILEH